MLVEIYICEGDQAAITFASESKIPLEGDRVNILIYTTGDFSEAFVDDLKELGFDQFNTSSFANVVWASVSIKQLLQLAEQDFVLYVTLPPKTYVVP